MKRYPAKILLFGEYLLLKGAPALSVPVPAFGGYWTQEGPAQPLPAGFSDSPGLAAAGIDKEALNRDLGEGWHFQSDIPQGYGLGSSGALCAAIYDRYAPMPVADLHQLKTLLGGMESYFHGASSGLDPLTSYLNRPILFEGATQIAALDPFEEDLKQPTVFLLDTGLPRQTAPLVAWFLDQCAEPAFARSLEQEIIPVNRSLIEAWRHREYSGFMDALKQLSAFQLECLPPMIPAVIRPLWERLLTEPSVALKLCGAGGGGFVLGFTEKTDILYDIARQFPLIFPFNRPKGYEAR